MSNEFQKRRGGFWGVVVLPQSQLMNVFSGRVTVDIPEGATVHSVHDNPVTLSMYMVITSKEEIPGVTFECLEGVEIPESSVTWTTNVIGGHE